MKKNNGNRKNSVRNFVSVFVIGLSVLFSSVSILSCNASILDNPTNDIEKENGETVPQYVEIIFSTALPSFGRKAIPNADEYANMTYRLTGVDEMSKEEQNLGLWGSLNQLRNASLKLHTGTWQFTLTAYKSWNAEASDEDNLQNAVLQDTIDVTLLQSTTLQFTLKEIEECKVNGSFRFTVTYSSSENWSVNAYILNAADLSEKDYHLVYQTYSDNTRISCESIPSGNYLLKIQFVYTIGDDSFESYTMPLIQIAAGLNTTGSTNLSADELNRFYNINYVLDNGVMPVGYVTEYNPYKSALLDNPTRENYKFLGWYFNNDWADENKLPVNENGNYVFNKNHDLSGNVSVYARWQRIGYVQDGFEWHLSDEGVLTISGEGEVPFAAYSFPEWVNATSAVVEEGVTGFHYYEYYKVGFGCSIDYYGEMEGKTNGYARNIKTISLPSTLTSIPNQCFDCLSSLEEINIPESVVSIGAYAFYGCKLLKELRLPDGLTSIGAHAFGKCSKLTSITIPASVTTIYMSAFSDWGAEQAITLDWNSTDTTVRSVNTSDFENVNTINIHYKDGKDSWPLWTRTHYEQDGFTWDLSVDGVLTIRGEGEVPFYARSFSEWKRASRIVVDEGITGFAYVDGYPDRTGFNSYSGYGANCQNVRTVSLPSTLTSIPDSCFENCSSLESIVIPSNVTSIATEAFYGCTSIEEITIPASVTTLYRSAFRDWTDEQEITFDWSSSDTTERTIYDSDWYTTGTSAKYNDGKAAWFSWLLSDDGVLTIRGTGEVPFYAYFSEWKNATSAVVEDGIIGFAYSDGYSSRIGFNGSGSLNIKTITLPTTLTSIPAYCFCNCTSLETVNIPENVTFIGEYAFYSCTALKSITIPSNVTSIDYYAFQNCTGISSITIPASVTTLYRSAFDGWTDEQAITFDWSSSDTTERSIYNTDWYTTGTNAKYKDGKAAWFSWVLSNDGVLTIRGNGDMPFAASESWKNATSAVIEEGVTGFAELAWSYGHNGFSDYYDGRVVGYTNNIKTIRLPSTFTWLCYHCFDGCTSLEEINIPSRVTIIKSYAFRGCSSLKTITIPQSVESIDEHAFDGCKSLTSFTIPSSVTSLGDYALAYCTGISSITVPVTVTEQFNKNVFQGWRSNQTITLDWNSNDSTHAMPSIPGSSWAQDDNIWTSYYNGTHAKYRNGTYAWNGCALNADGTAIIISGAGAHYPYNDEIDLTNVTSIIVQEGITSLVCNSIPDNNTTIKTISLPSSLTYLGDSVFEGFAGIEEITIPSSVTEIYRDAFRNCTSLKSITIPAGVEGICENTFDGCTSLETVSIPNSVTRIYEYAFRNCTSLKSISLPSALEQIDQYAFKDCTSLESVNFNSVSLAIPEECFAGCTSLSSVTGTSAITSIGKNAFRGCAALSTISLPSTLTSIDEYAFYKCTGFTALTIPSSVIEIGSSAFDYCTNTQLITLDWNAGDTTSRNIAGDAFGYAGIVVKYKDGTTYGN